MHDLLEPKRLKAIAIILAIFAIGLVGFYLFSAQYGDGLETTMDEAGIEESEPVYSGLLDYGDNYLQSLVLGILGFVITLLACVLVFGFMRKKNKLQD